MRKWLIAGLMFISGSAFAQSTDLGGVGTFISNIAMSAQGGTSVDFNKHVDAVMYVPYPTLHSADGKTEYALLGLGADLGAGVSGTQLHGAPLVLPMVNMIGATSFIFKSLWSQSHFSFPTLGNVRLGIGVKPLPISGTNNKWIIGNQISGVASIGFGK